MNPLDQLAEGFHVDLGLPWQPPSKTRKPSRDVPEGQRKLLRRRALGRCEACGEREPSHTFTAHHRKLRSRGGDHSLANLLLLHRLCHNKVHAYPGWSEEHGFMVASWQDPESVPVFRMGTWCRLDDLGGVQVVEGPER